MYRQLYHSVLLERINAIIIFVIILFLIIIDLHMYIQQQKYGDSFMYIDNYIIRYYWKE